MSHSPKHIWTLLGLLMLSSLFACEGEGPDKPPGIEVDRVPVELVVPNHFRTPEIPPDNPLTQAKIDLGKKLFYDPLLSRDKSVSCATCHPPEKAFSDPNALSIGIEDRESPRHGMALINLYYSNRFFWDGRKESLEDQALDPIFNPLEMDNTEEELIKRLNASEDYQKLFQRAFGDTASLPTVAKAIASFERTLISGKSKYDLFVETNDTSVFTDAELRGFDLFFAERFNARHAECFHCHGGFNFDDRANPAGPYRNNGLDEFYEDKGLALITQDAKDVGKFKVPTLRNIAFTAPYMHDGRFQTLEEVIDHYASGGMPHNNRDPLMNNIILDEQGKADVVAFLKTLSDPEFLSNPAFRPE